MTKLPEFYKDGLYHSYPIIELKGTKLHIYREVAKDSHEESYLTEDIINIDITPILSQLKELLK